MIQSPIQFLPDLYEVDETAWLDAMADLVRQGRLAELDLPHLAEFLADMAKRDRRAVKSRLAILLAHVLKWLYQPERRSKSWRKSMVVQRQRLRDMAGEGVLRAHADAVLADAYADAVERAAAETGLAAERFPAECPYTFEQLISPELLAEPQ